MVVAFTPAWFSFSAGTTGGGGGGGVPMMRSSTYAPRSTGDGAVGIGADHQHAALAQQAPARASP